jgi:hypothetical protein
MNAIQAKTYEIFSIITSTKVPLPKSDKDNSSYSITTTGGWIYEAPVVNVFRIFIDLA